MFKNADRVKKYKIKKYFFFNGNSIDVVSYYIYLRIMFTPNLVWSEM